MCSYNLYIDVEDLDLYFNRKSIEAFSEEPIYGKQAGSVENLANKSINF